MKIVFIGAGRLATHLATILYQQSYNIIQVFSRTLESAELLANSISSSATNDIAEITKDGDIYIFSVKDSVLESLIDKVPSNNGLWLHTSGSISINVFSGYTDRYGVLYPFQTFSKDRTINLKEVPLFIESAQNSDLTILEKFSKELSNKVFQLSSEKRKYVHLTGVFACNFVNHMYAISEEILAKENIPFDILFPLIDETTSKIHSMSPSEAQTGPAIRYDENIINKHLSLIDDPLLKEIYKDISQSIHRKTNI